MKESQAIKAFEKIAISEGVSVEQVRGEIQKAIDEAMKSTDSSVQEYWRKMPCAGDKPTPEEVVLYVAKQVKSL